MKLTTKQKNKIVEKYISRNQLKKLINASPEKGLFNIIVIPVLNEPEIKNTLHSLLNADKPEYPVEVILVINSKQNENTEIVEQNRKTYNDLINFAKENSTKAFKIHPLLFENLPAKTAGAGLARKIGMDEALLRFNQDADFGIITSLDADTLVEKNYLTELEKAFKNQSPEIALVYFEHKIEGTKYTENIYQAIAKYELYLRYYYQALKYIQFPFAYHTVGSAFAVTSVSYARYGGMSPKQAGEDFYFIQKVAKNKQVVELNSTAVYPSSRPSTRVIFGTGPAVAEISQTGIYNVYNLQSFFDVGIFLKQIPAFFKIEKENYDKILAKLPQAVVFFLNKIDFFNKLQKINNNTTTLNNFTKAFFTIFDSFSLIRFLNETHQNNYYKKKEITTQAQELLTKISNQVPATTEELLSVYRNLEKNTTTNKK